MKNIYKIRAQGRDYCQTEGSAHYKEGGIEPLDLMYAKGLIEDFCIGNILKYSTRFKVTRNLDDLKKVSDYAQILAGVELEKIEQKAQEKSNKTPDKVKEINEILGMIDTKLLTHMDVKRALEKLGVKF